jgi:hypothetical protein
MTIPQWYDLPSQPFGTSLTRCDVSNNGTISYEFTVTWWGLPFYWVSFVYKSLRESLKVTIISNLKKIQEEDNKGNEIRATDKIKPGIRDIPGFRKVH